MTFALGLYDEAVPYGIGNYQVGNVERLDSNLVQLIQRMGPTDAFLEVDPLQPFHHLVNHPVHHSFGQLLL